MKVKYNEAVNPLVGEHSGFVFQQSRTCDCVTTSKKNDRGRYTRQRQKMPNLMRAVSHWRNLDSVSKNAWSTFAATYPQPCKNPASGFLTGYQLFIKRQQYCFLNYGLSDEFLEAPLLQELIPFDFTFDVSANGLVIDVTENWIKNFGKLPEVGQNLLIKILPYSVASGQFFAPINQQITVENVYMDGLFVSLFFPVPVPDVVFSVYLSFPTSHGRKYQKSQSRYMGCFTSKTFLQLTDTPASYEGQAGKTVTVKEDESGLEFTEPSGGGLTCENLPACPTIVAMNATDILLGQTISQIGNISIPAIAWSFLYNPLVFIAGANMCPVGWQFPTEADFLKLAADLGGIGVAGTPMRESGTMYWRTGNTGTNAAKWNGRGNGYVYTSGNNGIYWDKSGSNSYWCSTAYLQYYWTFVLNYNQNQLYKQPAGVDMGYVVRLRKTTTSLPNGSIGSMVGNNGQIYRTIVIGGVEWMADDSKETKMRDGSAIFESVNLVGWKTLTTPAFYRVPG